MTAQPSLTLLAATARLETGIDHYISHTNYKLDYEHHDCLPQWAMTLDDEMDHSDPYHRTRTHQRPAQQQQQQHAPPTSYL